MPTLRKSAIFVGLAMLGAAGVGHAFDGAGTVASQGRSSASDAFAFQIAEPGVLEQWRAARSHATGQGADLDHWKAFQLYARIAALRFAGEPSRRDAPYVGGAMREMGRYYLAGIEGTPVARNPQTGEHYLHRAAALFGDADAQFELGRFYLDERFGTPRRRHAARWLSLATRKGHHRAKAELGALLCAGQGVARDAVRGILLMAAALHDMTEAERPSIEARLTEAFASVTETERGRVEIALRRANLPLMGMVAVADGS